MAAISFRGKTLQQGFHAQSQLRLVVKRILRGILKKSERHPQRSSDAIDRDQEIAFADLAVRLMFEQSVWLHVPQEFQSFFEAKRVAG